MAREILDRTPASHPRGSWPAEELAQQFRDSGIPATVVADLDSDSFLVVKAGGGVMTDAERKKLSEKVAKVNKRSESRPK